MNKNEIEKATQKYWLQYWEVKWLISLDRGSAVKFILDYTKIYRSPAYVNSNLYWHTKRKLNFLKDYYIIDLIDEKNR